MNVYVCQHIHQLLATPEGSESPPSHTAAIAAGNRTRETGHSQTFARRAPKSEFEYEAAWLRPRQTNPTEAPRSQAPPW